MKKDMVVVTARIDSDLKKKLDDYARQTGSNRSEVIIRALNDLLDIEKPRIAGGLAAVRNEDEKRNDDYNNMEMEGSVPIYSLDTSSRLILSLLNHIAAAVDNRDRETGQILDGESLEDQSKEYRKAAKALENGYAADYDNNLPLLAPELSARQTNEINDIMGMFRDLQSSYNTLSDEETGQMPEQCEYGIHCKGFDISDPRENFVPGYLKFLAENERWSDVYQDMMEHSDRGNSHHRSMPFYRDMLALYRQIRDQKRGFSWSPLTADEIKRITTPYGLWEEKK